MKMKYSDIEDAFNYISSCQQYEHTTILDKSTGQIHYRSEMAGIDEIPEELWGSDNAIEIPHKNDLNLGNQLVFDFVNSVTPEDYERVRDIFNRRGAYSRYKDFLDSKGLLQKWYDFEKITMEKAIRQWCREHKIELDDQQQFEENIKPEKIKNLKGILCGDIYGKYFIRTTMPDGSTRDYRVDHSDLSIEIQDDDAYIYKKDGDWIIDYSPATLGTS